MDFVGFAMKYFGALCRHPQDQQLYKIDRTASYEDLNSLFRGGRADTDLIKEQWDQLVRVASSLRSRTAPAHVVMQRLAASSPSDRLAKALTALGRIVIDRLYKAHKLSRRRERPFLWQTRYLNDSCGLAEVTCRAISPRSFFRPPKRLNYFVRLDTYMFHSGIVEPRGHHESRFCLYLFMYGSFLESRPTYPSSPVLPHLGHRTYFVKSVLVKRCPHTHS